MANNRNNGAFCVGVSRTIKTFAEQRFGTRELVENAPEDRSSFAYFVGSPVGIDPTNIRSCRNWIVVVLAHAGIAPASISVLCRQGVLGSAVPKCEMRESDRVRLRVSAGHKIQVGRWSAALKRLASAVRFRPWPPCFQ